MDERSVEKWWNEICDRGKREKPREKPIITKKHPYLKHNYKKNSLYSVVVDLVLRRP